MKLSASQLDAHLAKGLAPSYLVSGDEPLLVDEALDAIRAAAGRYDYSERIRHVAERGFDWDALRAELSNGSLFAERRLVEIRLPTGKPGDKGAKFFSSLPASPVVDTTLIVITPGIDRRTAKSKWVSTLAAHGAWLPLHAPNAQALPRWIASRLARVGLTADSEAAALLASRVEGNLLAARQEIDKLRLLVDGDRVTVEAVRLAVSDGARYDVFQLSDAALAGNSKRAVHVLHHVQEEGIAAPLALWSLVRDAMTVSDIALRTARGESATSAAKRAGVWASRQRQMAGAAARLSSDQARALMNCAAKADRIVKGAQRGDPWRALLELTLALAGAPVRPAETA